MAKLDDIISFKNLMQKATADLDFGQQYVQTDHDILYLPGPHPSEIPNYVEVGRYDDEGDGPLSLKGHEWASWSNEFDCWTMPA